MVIHVKLCSPKEEKARCDRHLSFASPSKTMTKKGLCPSFMFLYDINIYKIYFIDEEIEGNKETYSRLPILAKFGLECKWLDS